MTLDLITTVESVERRPDGHIVEIGIVRDAMLPQMIQELRARARAMIAVGLIDVGEGMGSDIARAIMNVSFDEVQRATEVMEKRDHLYEVKVNTE